MGLVPTECCYIRCKTSGIRMAIWSTVQFYYDTLYSTVRLRSSATATNLTIRKQLLPYYSTVLWVCCTRSEHLLGGQSVRFIRRNNKRRICIQNTTGNTSTRSPYTGTTGTLSTKYRNFKYYTTRRRVQPCISFAWLAEWLRYFLHENLLR